MNESNNKLIILIFILGVAFVCASVFASVMYLKYIGVSNDTTGEIQVQHTEVIMKDKTPDTVTGGEHEETTQIVNSALVSIDTDPTDIQGFIARVCNREVTENEAYDRVVKIASVLSLSQEQVATLMSQLSNTTTSDEMRIVFVERYPNIDADATISALCAQ